MKVEGRSDDGCSRCTSQFALPYDEVSGIQCCATCWAALAWEDSFYKRRATYLPSRKKV